MTRLLTIDDKNFDEVVLGAETPVLVDFWAPWCAPCQALAPMVEELAGEYEGRVSFAKVNVDENAGVASRYSIRSIPTLLVFKDGKPIIQIIGLRPKAKLKQHLDAALGEK